MIKEFQGDYRWLSNFAPVKIILDEIEYPSVEHAYMSVKNIKPSWKIFCANRQNSAGKVKRASKDIELKAGWDTIKLSIMRECLQKKFNQEPYKTKLLETGNQNIQEGNYWGDKFWGVCLKTGIGENHLGRMIMEIRNYLNESL